VQLFKQLTTTYPCQFAKSSARATTPPALRPPCGAWLRRRRVHFPRLPQAFLL
jgi:hypothetical protein